MNKNPVTVALGDMVDLVPFDSSQRAPLSHGFLFGIIKSLHKGRFEVFEPGDISAVKNMAWLTIASQHTGDAPHLYHPVYLMAVIASEDFFTAGGEAKDLASTGIPAISFTTDEWTRRSMTLNGMRMSTEFFATGSLRVLDLVRQRLEAGQSDVVHDVLVYLMRQIIQERALAYEERALRAESIAAYLGVDPHRVVQLLRVTQPQDQNVARELSSGFAGPIRREIDVAQVVTNQMQMFHSEMRLFTLREQNTLSLIDPIVAQLYIH